MNESPETRQHTMICPSCESGELRPFGRVSMRCFSCDQVIGGPMLETLRNIYILPDAIGKHACECGHPEMKHLPDGVYWCPACGSEVLPANAAHPISWRSEDRSEAYWCGWLDGRYSPPGDFTRNSRLARWEDPRDRLDYYQGHRQGVSERTSTHSSEEAA
ncbi:MAG: hypothetical protein ACRDSJ_01995 [Rubrobacteraceae bacterium]